MFNPLAPFTEQALMGMTKEGHRYFVRQTFPRGLDYFEEGIKGSFLFCHYQEYPPAKEHFDALADDPHRFLYDWEDEEHRKKLVLAAGKPKGYKIFTNTFLLDWELHVTVRLKQKITSYIKSLGWKPAREDPVIPVFYPHFGEVMVSLKFRRQEVRVKFEEIEKLA